MNIGCLKYVFSPTSGSLDLPQITAILLLLNSRQFVSLLLECEAGFYWRILKSTSSELSVLHVDLPLCLKESCVTLSHANHASLRALGWLYFPRTLYPLVNIPDQGKQ